MRSLLVSVVMALFVRNASAVSPRAFVRGVVGRMSPPTLFGIRGGGLFGGKADEESTATATREGDGKMYPAMSQEEIEEWMEHIPVFAVTDSNGAGVVLKPDDDTSVFYFFLNPIAANSTLTQLISVNQDMDLRVSAFSLGKIWFKLLNADPDQEVILKSPGSEEEGQAAKGVQYRLVPDTRDLLGARMLLTMTPEDSEKLKEGESMTPEMAQQAIEKAMTQSPKFKETYNEIPVFTIAQMRMQTQPKEGDDTEPITLLPMYFSLQNMVGTWQQFMSQADPDMQGVEPAINLMSLHDLVGMMQKESEIDFRNVVLVASAPEGAESASAPDASATISAPGAGMSSMGGATLGDL